MKEGDDHGPDIVSGNAADSPLIKFVTSNDDDEVMPPEGKLPISEIEMLTRWVQEGAVWPDGVDAAKLEDRRDHWSFKPLKVAGEPIVAFHFATEAALKSSKIDSYIDAKLAEKGLIRSPPADPIHRKRSQMKPLKTW